MKNVTIPADLQKEYEEWLTETLLPDDAAKDDERYRKYFEAIKLAQTIFQNGEHVDFDDTECKYNRHVITVIFEEDIMVEDENVVALSKLLSMCDYANFGNVDGKVNRLYFGFEGIYYVSQ